MLDYGANPNLKDCTSNTVLHNMVCGSNTDFNYVDLLFKYSKYPIDVNLKNNKKQTPLQMVDPNCKDIIFTLLDNGADYSFIYDKYYDSFNNNDNYTYDKLHAIEEWVNKLDIKEPEE